jgi:hypothetical protein
MARDLTAVAEGLCATGSRWASPRGRLCGLESAMAEVRHDRSGTRVPKEMGGWMAHPTAHYSHQGKPINGRECP